MNEWCIDVWERPLCPELIIELFHRNGIWVDVSRIHTQFTGNIFVIKRIFKIISVSCDEATENRLHSGMIVVSKQTSNLSIGKFEQKSARTSVDKWHFLNNVIPIECDAEAIYFCNRQPMHARTAVCGCEHAMNAAQKNDRVNNVSNFQPAEWIVKAMHKRQWITRAGNLHHTKWAPEYERRARAGHTREFDRRTTKKAARWIATNIKSTYTHTISIIMLLEYLNGADIYDS